MKYKITIIGATDGFGLWLARYLEKHYIQYCDIIITGRDQQKATNIQSMHLKFLSDNIAAVKNADIVVFSVPIHSTEKTLEELALYVKKDAIILDVTSVKQMPSQAMKKYYPQHLCIPTHPMFGPYVAEIAGQIVVLTPELETKQDARYQMLKNILVQEGARVIEVTPQENDKMMAVVQGLTHYNMFVIGETLQAYDFDMLSSLDFVSPVYKMMIASVARYIGQNPTLYADIQMYNPEILKIHKLFAESAAEFNRLVENKDRQAFIDMVHKIREFMSQEACDFGQQYTDKIIYLLTHQKQLAQKNIGKKITIKNIYSQEDITGTLEKLEGENICIDGQKYNENIWVISDV